MNGVPSMAYGSPVLVDAAADLTGADVPLLLLLLGVVTDESVVDVALEVDNLVLGVGDLLLEVFVVLFVLLEVASTVVSLCVFVVLALCVTIFAGLVVAASVKVPLTDSVARPTDAVLVVVVTSLVAVRVALAITVADPGPLREPYALDDTREGREAVRVISEAGLEKDSAEFVATCAIV